MGIGMWLGMGLVAALIARVIPPARPAAWLPEALSALAAATIAGLGATALDFGGWREADWRAGLFALLCSFAAIGVVRLVRVWS